MFSGLHSSPSDTPRTEDRILAAARSLLATGGVEACSMRAVAERSGVTAGAIYRHYRDKEVLVERVVGISFEHFEMTLLEAVVSLPVGSFARIAALGEAYIRFAEKNEEEFKILFMPLLTSRKRMAELPGQGGYPILRRCIVEAMESGEIRDADPDLVAFYLWSRVHGIIMLTLACDFSDEFEAPGGLSALNMFQLTREFVTAGLQPDD
jgi:AcrR family transcriptional regulator